ncbi:MAG: hypothetical protein EOO45_06255 [Flavobacterium sp.]|nr:MAG: hypothetical protein EOO45_06255 [Flavobacterium sp.]
MRISKNILILLLLLTACKEKDNISAEVYKNKSVVKYSGHLYTTEYGGLNYYVPDTKKRDELFSFKLIDSIVFNINCKRYIAKPLECKAYSRERNNSDFSFFVDKEDNHIVIDTIDGLHTILLFSEKTDMEILKENAVIKSEFIDKK